MSEWQPARLIPVHGFYYMSKEESDRRSRLVWHVRPAEANDHLVEEYRAKGCKATKFYKVLEVVNGYEKYACECEVLTD
jgi:hypothetical protein